MKILLISDLHIGAKPDDNDYYSKRIERLCEFISSKIKEHLFIFVLGDVVHCGESEHFKTAERLFMMMRSRLRNKCDIIFIPGNHDYCESSREEFNNFVKQFQPKNRIMPDEMSASIEAENINFILCDSINNCDHNKPGKLNLNAVKYAFKPGKQNIVLMHHSLIFEDSEDHTGIVDYPETIKCLNQLGIQYVFHGHSHGTRIFNNKDGINLIGVGSLTQDTSVYLENSNDQFNLVDISGKYINTVTNYRYFGDLRDYFSTQIIPVPDKEYCNPKYAKREEYDLIEGYIERSILPYNFSSDDSSDEFLREFLHHDNVTTLPIVAYNPENKPVHVILFSDAGMGKTRELQQLAAVFYTKNEFTFPCLLKLSEYDGKEIRDLLPKSNRGLNPFFLVLVMDGYDEIPDNYRRTFRQKLEVFMEENKEAKIILSMRSTFMEESSKSGFINKFDTYKLLELNNDDINNFVSGMGIVPKEFRVEAEVKSLTKLLGVPFYLEAITGLYLENKQLPEAKATIDGLINQTTKKDCKKYENAYRTTLAENEFEQKELLRKLAFALQLLKKSHLDIQDYQNLFRLEQRQLLELSSLLNKETEGFSFSHGNFREYLTAQYLNEMSFDKFKTFITLDDGNTINLGWVNVLSYLVLIRSDDDVRVWLSKVAPLVLVKSEASRIPVEIRFGILNQELERVKRENTWFDRAFCNEVELAIFCQSAEAIDLLLKEIANPTHYRAQYFALSVISRLNMMFGENDEIRRVLYNCCLSDETRPHERRVALFALGKLTLGNEDLTKEIINRFFSNGHAYDRLGTYDYLIEMGLVDRHADVFLHGLELLYQKKDEPTGGAEQYTICNALKVISQEEAVITALKWLTENDISNLYSQQDIVSHLNRQATELYCEGNDELYSIMEKLVLVISKGDTSQLENIFPFFEYTNTIKRLLKTLLQSDLIEAIGVIETIINRNEALSEELLSWYENGLHVSGELIVSYIYYVNTSVPYFHKFDDAIHKKTGKRFEPVNRVDRKALQSLKSAGIQYYFDSLFSRERIESLLQELIRLFGNDDITIEELIETDLLPDKYRYYAALQLKDDIVQFPVDLTVKVRDVLCKIDWVQFSRNRILRFIHGQERKVKISDEQRLFCQRWFDELVKTVCFADAIKNRDDDPPSPSKNREVFCALGLWLCFKFNAPESFYLGLLSIQSFYVLEPATNGISVEKLRLIENCVSPQKIKKQISENIAAGIPSVMIREYISYCQYYWMPDAKEIAITACQRIDQSEYCIREAMNYLVQKFEKKFILSKLLPLVCKNAAVLVVMADVLNYEYDKALENALLPLLKVEGEEPLVYCLIRMGSKKGLEAYLAIISKQGRTIDSLGHFFDATEAIATISNYALLPTLIKIAEVCFTDGFQDKSVRSLYSNLLDAIAKCARNDFDNVHTEMLKLRESIKENPEFRGFCSNAINRIRQYKMETQARSYTIAEAKTIIGSC